MNNLNQPNSNRIIIIGAGGHAISVANVALSAGYIISYFIDENITETRLLGIKIIKSISLLSDYLNYNYTIAIGDNSIRQKVYSKLSEEYNGMYFPTLIHKSAVASNFTSIEEGTVIMPNATVGPNSKVGKFCIINTNASIDHDSQMLDFSSLAPHAVVGGNVKIGLRTAISIGSVVKHKIEIGNDSILGGGAYLNKNLDSNKVAYGNPAREIRHRNSDDPYLY